MKRAALLCVTLLLLFGMTACASGRQNQVQPGERKALPLNRDRPGRSQLKRAPGKHRRRAILRFSPSQANRLRRQRSRIQRARLNRS